MNFEEINPYVRFVRTQKQIAYKNKMVALDNRIFYCISGNGEMIIDGCTVKIEEGTLVYWSAAVPYTFLPSKQPLCFIGCNFDFTCKRKSCNIPVPPVRASAFTPKMLTDPCVINDETVFCRYFTIQGVYFLKEKFAELRDEYDNKQMYSSKKCTALLTEILVAAARLKNLPDSKKTNDTAAKVISYIKENYRKNITYKEIGAEFHYHPNYISKLMIQFTGTTLHKFLTDYRMNKAIALLQSTDYPIQTVAELSGIPDASHFSKCFKKHTGKAPSDYRNFT